MWKQSFAALALLATSVSSQATTTELQGIWAMLPLKSGVANVIEFTMDRATVHAFECYATNKSDSSADPETSTYKLNQNNIMLSADGVDLGTLEIKNLSESELTLFQKVEGAANGGSSFVYRKTTQIKPLCELYQEPS